MILEVSAMELRKEIGHFLNEVKFGHNSFVIKRGKEEMGAIINMQIFNRLRELERNYQKVNAQLAAVGDSMDEAAVDKLVNDAVAFARGKK